MGPSTSEPLGLDLSNARGDDYSEYAREQLFALLERPYGCVLDIGCARGAGARALRDRGASHLVGLEIDAAYAEVARCAYDEVVTGSADDDLPWEPGSFDTVLCYDVLEHTYDPWSILGRVRTVLKPGGRLQVSLPNSRNIAFWSPLLVKGTFGYEPSGLRDVTHIRFFTRRDIVRTIEAAGFDILRVAHTGNLSAKRRLAMVATAGLAIEFFAHQWVIIAQPRSREQC